MKNKQIKERLHHYIETADEKKLKAIYTMVEEEIEEATDMWRDKEFVAELERREKRYLNGAKTYSIQESVGRAREAIKKVKSK